MTPSSKVDSAPPQCPSRDRLKQLCEGSSFGQVEVLRQHISHCGACQETLAHLQAEAELDGWRNAIRPGQKTGHDDSTDVQEVERFLQKVKQAFSDELTPSNTPGATARPSGHDIVFPTRPSEEAPLGWLDHYRILSECGRGAIGVVFQAYDERLRRVVALKVLKPELAAKDDHRRRFQREGRAAAAVEHDHILAIHHVGESAGFVLPYLVLEYIDGESLSERIRRIGPPATEEAARIVREAALGLHAAHEAGLLHRDVKSSNIMVENKTGRAKIMDFGLVREIETNSTELTATGCIVGTPAYMSPEQITNPDNVDPRSDVYSLGIVFFELLTGERPFHGNEMNVLRQMVQEEPPAAAQTATHDTA